MDEVIVETEGSLGRIRLNRPKALNALNHEMVGLIDRALDRFGADGAVTAVLLTGEGERALCAGATCAPSTRTRRPSPRISGGTSTASIRGSAATRSRSWR